MTLFYLIIDSIRVLFTNISFFSVVFGLLIFIGIVNAIVILFKR